MKKLCILLLIFTLCLSGCTTASGISPEAYDQLEQALEAAQVNLNTLETDLASLQGQYDDLQVVYEALRQAQVQSHLRNISWQELETFLTNDDTSERTYQKSVFDCSGFAITLRDHAWHFGIRCAYVEVGFAEGEGHAFNAFETTDRGIIWVDNTAANQIAYVEAGRSYGTIHLDGVRSDFIDCSGSPGDFWDNISYTTHSNPFSYDYYVDYQARRQFYMDSVAAYNKAGGEYNSGSTKWTYAQLNTWAENLEALEEELGSILYEPLGTVSSIETYWN